MTAACRKRPSAGPRITEAQVLRGVLEYLEHDPRVLVWRSNTGGTWLPGKGGREQFVRFGLRGSADITGVIRGSGRRLEVEVKRPGGVPSPAQVAFAATMRGAGAVYLLVTSVADARQQLDAALAAGGAR